MRRHINKQAATSAHRGDGGINGSSSKTQHGAALKARIARSSMAST